MSRRQHILSSSEPVIPFAENLVFHAPLTSDMNDIIGGKQPYTTMGNPTVTENGIILNDSIVQYNFTQQEAVSVKTIYCVIKPVSQKYTYDYYYNFGKADTTPSYRGAICRNQSGGKVYITVSKSSAKYDYDLATSENFPINGEKKLTFVFEPNSQKLYSDGVLIWNSGAADYWNAWSSQCSLVLGGRQQSITSGRNCNAIIKDFRMYNRALSASEVAQL